MPATLAAVCIDPVMLTPLCLDARPDTLLGRALDPLGRRLRDSVMSAVEHEARFHLAAATRTNELIFHDRNPFHAPTILLPPSHWPPSITMTAPLMKLAASEQRKT